MPKGAPLPSQPVRPDRRIQVEPKSWRGAMHWWWIMLKGAVLPIMAIALGLAGHRLFSAIAALDPSGASGAASWRVGRSMQGSWLP